jgi:hypothetical protein
MKLPGMKLEPVARTPDEFYWLRDELPDWEIGIYYMPWWYWKKWGTESHYLYVAKQELGERVVTASSPRELISQARNPEPESDIPWADWLKTILFIAFVFLFVLLAFWTGCPRAAPEDMWM